MKFEDSTAELYNKVILKAMRNCLVAVNVYLGGYPSSIVSIRSKCPPLSKDAVSHWSIISSNTCLMLY